MNFAFFVVVIAAVTGLAAQLALREIAPASGPALALFVMAVGLLGTAWRLGRKRAADSAPAELQKASQSLAPT